MIGDTEHPREARAAKGANPRVASFVRNAAGAGPLAGVEAVARLMPAVPSRPPA